MDDITATHLFLFVILAIIIIAASYYFYRWLFAIDKRVKQNDAIISLLIKIAEKQGATSDEIYKAMSHPFKL